MENGNVVQVDMMKQYKVEFRFIEYPSGLPMNAYHLKYKGDKIFMTILLPDEGFTLSDIEDGITQDILYDIISSDGHRVVDDISLPKFKLEYKTEVIFLFKFNFFKAKHKHQNNL
jgi:serine protease inhibitor